MKTAPVVAVFVLTLQTACAPESAPDGRETQDDRPNVLLIVADDMGYSEGAYALF